MPALLSALLEGDVLSRLAQKELVQQRVGPAGDMGDGSTTANPRLVPRDSPILQLGDDAIGDSGVQIKCHGESSFALSG